MVKQNCWEFFDCAPEVQQTCPAANDASLNGKNGGINGGRICWKVPGAELHEGKVDRAKRMISCFGCDFFKKVQDEEGKYLE